MAESAFSMDFEGLLREALHPVDPPEDLAARLDATLTNLTDLAAEELDSWELGAMKDPRNWVRPVVASGVGAVAGTALVLLRVRANHRHRAANASDPLELAEQTLRAAVDETRRLLDR